MRRHYEQLMMTQPEQWRVGRGVAKLAKIDDSVIFDRMREDKVQMMLKFEVYPQVFGAPKEIKKARGIQFTVNERTAYEHGSEAWCFAKAYGKATEEAQTVEGIIFDIRYSATMSHAAIGEFATESERIRKQYKWSVIDERDGINWDSSIQTPHRGAVATAYGDVSPKLSTHALGSIKVKGSALFRDQGVKIFYEVDGTVKSGHWDTSVGSSLLNREVTIAAIIKLPDHLKPKYVRGLVMGDDLIVWLYFDRVVDPTELRQALTANERALGIDPVRGLFDDLRYASYISLGFYKTINGTYLALPKVGRMFAKLFWTVTPLQGRDPRRLAAGVAKQFLPLYASWPPMRQFLKHHMQVEPIEAHNVFYDFQEMGLKRISDPIPWEENHLVKYGAIASALNLDEWMEGQGAGLAHHPAVAEMYVTDVADPCDRRGVLP